MILAPNDPTGHGLFSKCARNQAAKSSRHRPRSANVTASRVISQDLRKKNVSYKNQFDLTETRAQREKKYVREETPAVGSYNVNATRTKPKLVWDILKVYNQSRVKQSKKNETDPNEELHNNKKTEENTVIEEPIRSSLIGSESLKHTVIRDSLLTEQTDKKTNKKSTKKLDLSRYRQDI